MKQLKNLMLCSVAFLAMTVTGCNNNNGPVEDSNEVSVFVLSGQSNMEGNTSFQNGTTDLIAQAFQDMELEGSDVCVNGINEVQLSSYCVDYGKLDHTNLNNSRVNATNAEDKFAGKFVPTKAGYGLNNTKMGPEVGCAYALREEASEEKPIFFIKMASGGSGFEQGDTQYNWPVKDADGNWPEINMYHCFCKPFVENNLRLIEAQGFKPVIKGWLWHQGESDTAQSKIDKYAQRLGDMVELFRTDFAQYAKDENGANIAFVDGMIYQGEGTAWGAQTSVNMNNVKKQFAESADNNYLVDIYGNQEEAAANELKPGQPGGDSMHYNVPSILKLGMGYAKVILENHLLD